MSLAAILSDQYQDQIVIVPTPSAVTAGFGLLGTLGLAGLVQRRRKSQATV
jgi:MYXO-CTERM domain-containing protein